MSANKVYKECRELKEEIYTLESLVEKLKRKVKKLEHANRSKHSEGYQVGLRDGVARSISFIRQYEAAKKNK